MKINEVKVFENKELRLQARTIFNPDGSISINAEDTAIGFGWTQEKNGKIYVKWERMNGYCKELGFSPEVGKDDYIPESLYYLLGMKASNEKAQKYQKWLAIEVLPELRKNGSYKIPDKEAEKQRKTKQEKLQSVNKAVSNIDRIFTKAGIEPIYIAAEAKRLYSEAGYEINIPLITDNTMQKLWDCTSIAKELGITSESGRPHDKAVSAIIQKLDIFENEVVRTAYTRNGHDGVTVQYKDSVFSKVKEWLEENGYPTVIELALSNGNTNKCRVVYRDVA